MRPTVSPANPTRLQQVCTTIINDGMIQQSADLSVRTRWEDTSLLLRVSTPTLMLGILLLRSKTHRGLREFRGLRGLLRRTIRRGRLGGGIRAGYEC